MNIINEENPPNGQIETNTVASSTRETSTSVRVARKHNDVKNVAAAARYIGCSVQAVYSAIKAGGLNSRISDKGITEISTSDLKAFQATWNGNRRKRGRLEKAKPAKKAASAKGAKKAGNKPKASPSVAAKSPRQSGSNSAPGNPVTQDVLIKDINFDHKLQVRVELCEETVAKYKQEMEDGEKFPPIDLFKEGKKFVIGDGWHRLKAATEMGLNMFPAIVHTGGRKGALRFALKANSHYGLARSHADKRRALTLAVDAFGNLANRMLARMCGVSDTFVGKWRPSCEKTAPDALRLGADGKMQPATKSQPPEIKAQLRQKVAEKRVERFCMQVPTLDNIELLRRVRAAIDERIIELEAPKRELQAPPRDDAETPAQPESEAPPEADLDTPPPLPTEREWGPVER